MHMGARFEAPHPVQWTQLMLADSDTVCPELWGVGGEMLSCRGGWRKDTTQDPLGEALGVRKQRDKGRKKMDIPLVIQQTLLRHLLCARF